MKISVIVKPGSQRVGVSEENGALVLRVRERAIGGAANSACILALAAAYAVAPSAVRLVSGFHSRHKRFSIERPNETKGRR